MSESRAYILLIDDDLDMHEVVRLILGPDCTVTAHTTAAAGLATLAAQPPDLLILDVMLSTPTEGLEVARQLRQAPATQALPILLISAASPDPDATVRQASGAADADAFLEKPIDPRALREAVAALLKRDGTGGTP